MRKRVAAVVERACRVVLVSASLAAMTGVAEAQLVPGTGVRNTEVGDDFEDPEWRFDSQFPKSSSNLDGQERQPAGMSANNRLYESTYRGVPDVVERIPTPPGGIPGSQGALLIRSLWTGVPGRPSFEQQQDDLMINVETRIGGYTPVARGPSIVTRVYLPPFQYWERRTGTSFGFRADVEGYKPQQQVMFRRRMNQPEMEFYWPGIFIQFNSKASGYAEDSATLLIRADERGQDIIGPQIKEPGWWTLGMSFTPDGRVHYYARPGVEKLTAADHIASTYPYGFRCERFHTFFFNVVNRDDGRTWSTPWIVDDPELYFLPK